MSTLSKADLLRFVIQESDLQPDGHRYTNPRSYGAYQLSAPRRSGKQWAFGNHPVRRDELNRCGKQEGFEVIQTVLFGDRRHAYAWTQLEEKEADELNRIDLWDAAITSVDADPHRGSSALQKGNGTMNPPSSIPPILEPNGDSVGAQVPSAQVVNSGQRGGDNTDDKLAGLGKESPTEEVAMHNTMAYKGYIARIEYDCRDELFVGHVLGVDDRISFHGDTVAGLKASFHAAIDHYLNAQRPGN